MSNYISFSLWGDKPIYNVGAIKNAELYKKIYPGWKMVLYHDDTAPKNTIDKLKELDVQTIESSHYKSYGMFWRFFAESLPDCEYVIFRDCDSRISEREKLAVDEWIKSGKSIHVMRDHPYHRIPYGNNGLGILGGMWGIKSNIIPLKEMIDRYCEGKTLDYGSDQTFLKSIYLIFQNDRCTHDDFFEKYPFPTMRIPGEFVGGRIDENDKPVGEDYKLVL
jgi:hypothetical protein